VVVGGARPVRQSWTEALRDSRVLELLAPFEPRIAGTPPLGLDLPDSDIDVLCHAPDPERFSAAVREHFGASEGFSIRQWRSGEPAIVANFRSSGWEFEVFGQAGPVERQAGWRHFRIEQRLLGCGRDPLRKAVMAARRAGLKTEPAFAAVLGLQGDPYLALLDLEQSSDEALATLVGAALLRAGG
jgi:hypothetical protein